jgi:hypothetical protein
MDILIALVERPGELVTKEELMARVRPNVFVDPANLAVHYFCASSCPPGSAQWKSIHHQYPLDAVIVSSRQLPSPKHPSRHPKNQNRYKDRVWAVCPQILLT